MELRRAGRAWIVASLAAVATFAHGADETIGCPAVAADAAPGIEARENAVAGPFTRPESTVPANKRTTRGLYLTATDASELVGENPAGVLFIDVRTRGELEFNGMPAQVDAHVPYLIEAQPLAWDEATSSFRFVVNPDFVAAVDRRLARKGLTREAVVVVICQGGVRAARATDALTAAGYGTVYTVVDGFEGDPVAEGPQKGLRLVNGWRNAGLPWTTRLDRTKMYGLD